MCNTGLRKKIMISVFLSKCFFSFLSKFSKQNIDVKSKT